MPKHDQQAALSAAILSDTVVHLKYAKFLPEKDRRENWTEIVDRNKAMHLKRFPQLAEEIHEAYAPVYEKKVLGSMRGMQFGGKAIELNPCRQYNCSYVAVDAQEVFSEVFFLLLSGSGVGYSVQRHHVEKLPEINRPTKTKRYLVGDSIEGWADSVKILMNAYFTGKPSPIFDFRSIRPKGTPLVTSGGVAPGPEDLKEALYHIQKVLDRKQSGESLTTLECHDILCYISEAVMSGGIRRAAMIALFDLDDEDMLTCKFGKWYETDPQRGRANNSAVLLRHKIDKSVFLSLWEKIQASGSGEPGFLFSNDKEMGINPCLSGDTLVYVADGRGYVSIKTLADEEKDVPVFCLNDRGAVAVRMMRHPRLTGVNSDLLEIEIDNGHKIKVTPEHKFLLTDGKYVEAKNLQPNDSLKIITRYEASIKDIFPAANSRSQDYFWVNSGRQSSYAEHRFIAAHHSNIDLQTGMVVHHKDRNGRNNSPNNLEIMDKKKHDELHGVLMRGDHNPMRRAKYEWPEEKWNAYRDGMSKRNIGENNKNYSGFTNEDLQEAALELTKQLGRRFSLAEWQNYAAPKGLPIQFSKWRNDHCGGIVGLAKWAAIKSEVEYPIDVDPRVVRTYIRAVSEGYDANITHGRVFVHKICERSGKEFDVPWNRREVSIHPDVVAEYRSALTTKQWTLKAYRLGVLGNAAKTFERKKDCLRKKQIVVYKDIEKILRRAPQKKEWVDACKEHGVSFEISRKSSPFRYYQDLIDAADTFNHRVVAIRFVPSENVYNGTVDEFHNFFVGGFEEKTRNGKQKWVSLVNRQCGEVSLKSAQFCNLSNINSANIVDQDDLNARAKSAAFIGTLQAAYTDFHYLRDIWKTTTEKDALLGVSLAGVAAGKVLELDIEAAAEIVKAENARVAKLIGINKASRCTVIKPDGHTSLVLGASSGVHAYHSEFYMRRVKIEKSSAIYTYLSINHPELLEEDFFKPTKEAFICVPQKAPDGAITREEPAINMLERVRLLYMRWIKSGYRKGANQNNVSATVTIKPDEWEKVGEWMWKHRDEFTALSVLPFSDHSYIQPPFTEISKTEYYRLAKTLKEVDLNGVVEVRDNTALKDTVACAAGQCEV